MGQTDPSWLPDEGIITIYTCCNVAEVFLLGVWPLLQSTELGSKNWLGPQTRQEALTFYIVTALWEQCIRG